ncbi:MAG: MFS transporter [Chloroflexi bacterium]|nr:MFS transporter [Chloroflexota bacterium]
MNNTPTFQRNLLTWLAYLMLALYAYFINVIGPITPFLKEELGLTYTVSSLHYTAFALGILLVGFGGHTVIQRIGRTRALWLAAFGLSAGALLLLLGRTAPLTIGAAFGMGLIGSLILIIVPSALSDQHGESRAVALSEANVIASILSTAAPLMVGWTATLPGGWRLALGIAALAPFLMLLGLGRARLPQPASPQAASVPAPQALPPLFWVYWVAIVLSVAVEFCMISWSADFLEKTLHLPLTDAAKAVSLFLAAMIVGRIAVSRLVQRFSVRGVVIVSVLVASLGFGLFWLTGAVVPGLIGLFLTGLGVAGLYPLLLSLAMGVAGSNTTQASARTTLASGTAILILPLALGRLADLAGIRSAYAIVGVLLIGVFLIVLTARRRASVA